MSRKVNILSLALAFLCVGAVFISSCKEDDPVPEPLVATSIELVSGGSQSSTVETDLTEAVVVLVKDQNNTPLSGAEVGFTTSNGSGEVSVATATTDAEGKASVIWTLGVSEGEQTLTAISGEMSVEVTAIGTEVLVASSISIVSGDNQSASIDTELADAIVVLVKDQNGATLSGAEVAFTTSNGSVSLTTTTSDADGKASVNWTLGATEGAQTLTSTSGEVSIEVTATGTEAKVATSIVLVSGADQSGDIETALGSPVVVKVADQDGAAFDGATVTFTVTEGVVGAGTDLTIDVSTDAEGKASVSWALGATEGVQALTVAAMAADGITPLSGSPINVLATASSGIINGTMSDLDGNTYKTVIIGTQEWMAENLRVTQTSGGTAITLVTDNTAWVALSDNNTDAAYCYNNNDANGEIYGALYTYAAAKGVCPVGWHLPSSNDWTTLHNYLANNGYNYDGSSGGGYLKIGKSLASVTNWDSHTGTGSVGNDLSKNNASGFTGLPGGFRSGTDGLFWGVGDGAYWWSSQEYNGTGAFRRQLGHDDAYLYTYGSYMSDGVAVRCLKD